MSVDLLNNAKKWAKKVKLDPNPRFVLYALADITNKKHGNRCYPPYKYIRDYTGFSESAISKYLKILVASGGITIVKHQGKGKYENNVYTLVFEGTTKINPTSKRLVTPTSRLRVGTYHEATSSSLPRAVDTAATSVNGTTNETETVNGTSKTLVDLNDLNDAFNSQTTEPASSSYKKVEAILDANYSDIPATQDEIEGIANLVIPWGEIEFEFLDKFIKSKKWNHILSTPSDLWFRLRSKNNPLVLNDNSGSLPTLIAKAAEGRARFKATQTQLESSAQEHDTSDLDLERKDKEMEAEYF